MSDNRNQQMCELFQADLAELALGILSGRTRSETLEHVETCRWCSAELEQLSTVADAVLQLAPELEPPLGFELRLSERMRSEARNVRPIRPRRVRAFAAAAVFIVILGVGLGVFATSQGNTSQPWSTTASLTSTSAGSQGRVLGEVFLSAGSPGWIVMTVKDGGWSGAVTCEVTLTGGKVVVVGKFSLSNGYGTWGLPLTTTAHGVQSARLVSSDGAVIASARLSA
jgi:hypothetical protein